MPTVTVTLPNDGENADAVDVSAPILAILAVLNGGLDDDNISSVSGTKLNASTVPISAMDATALKSWASLAYTPNTITYNGNRSYDLVFNSVDLTGVLEVGHRVRLSRTVTAPLQCAGLNGTNQYFSKTSPSGMTFTDDFAVAAWVKLTSYNSAGAMIASRYNGTSGWSFYIDSAGRVNLQGNNAGAGNYRSIVSYDALPLNRWVHVSAQLDMSTFTNTSTTSYIMFDGVDKKGINSQAGTNPTALIQAGNFEIGSANAATTWPGRIAQVAVFSAKVTQATMCTYMSQTLTGSESNLISAYTFNNSLSDLNVSNANNMTANNGASSTTADSPFANNAGGVYEYGIVMAKSFSTNTTVTVQVPEGCMIPTTGGVSLVAFSTASIPFGMPHTPSKWRVLSISYSIEQAAIGGTNAWTIVNSNQLTVPTGDWRLGFRGEAIFSSSVSGARDAVMGLFTGTPTNPTAGVLALGQTITDRFFAGAGISTTDMLRSASAEDDVSLTTASVYSLYGAIFTATGTESWYVRGQQNPMIVYADNAHL